MDTCNDLKFKGYFSEKLLFVLNTLKNPLFGGGFVCAERNSFVLLTIKSIPINQKPTV